MRVALCMIAAFGCILIALPLAADVILSDSHNFAQGMATGNGASPQALSLILKHPVPAYAYVVALAGFGMVVSAFWGLAQLLRAERRPVTPQR